MTINDLIVELQKLPPEQRAMEACVFVLDNIRPITAPVAEQFEWAYPDFTTPMSKGQQFRTMLSKNVMVIS